MPVMKSGMKITLKAMIVIQKWILPIVSFIIRPNILGNQKVTPAKVPMIAIGTNV